MHVPFWPRFRLNWISYIVMLHKSESGIWTWQDWFSQQELNIPHGNLPPMYQFTHHYIYQWISWISTHSFLFISMISFTHWCSWISIFIWIHHDALFSTPSRCAGRGSFLWYWAVGRSAGDADKGVCTYGVHLLQTEVCNTLFYSRGMAPGQKNPSTLSVGEHLLSRWWAHFSYYLRQGEARVEVMYNRSRL